MAARLMPDHLETSGLDGGRHIRSRAIVIDGKLLQLGPRFGVTAWRTGESSASLLSRVDAAVYKAKAAGRDRLQVAP